MEQFYKKNPLLIKHVIFTDNISDPAKLYDLYNKSKIFCMPSRWEGFPLAAAEAAIFGNILILGEAIFAYETLTDNGKWGYKINEQNIADTLNSLLSDTEKQRYMIAGLKQYARDTFTWQTIMSKIHRELSTN
jgi:glycosyltransferase involved in cell wall biosynthesis